jgi:IS5 family transposase
LSAQLQETGDFQAIDATGFDRVSASHYYTNRTNYTFNSVKTTARIDCGTSLILDIHCSMKQPHDTQIGWQVLKRNLHRVETLTAEKGYDWDEFRRYLREADVRPVIKHRKFSSLDAAHNARIDDETYHRRSVVESVLASLRRRFNDTIRARTWFGQFRKLVLKAAVKNIEDAIKR